MSGESRGERGPFLPGVILFAALVPLLVRLPWPALERLLRPRRARFPASPARVVAAVESARRLGWPFVRPGCLARTVTRCYFLRRAGIACDLCFGVGYTDRGFSGHCWLSRAGEPYLEPADTLSEFTAVHRLTA